jgi:hypothetical protein
VRQRPGGGCSVEMETRVVRLKQAKPVLQSTYENREDPVPTKRLVAVCSSCWSRVETPRRSELAKAHASGEAIQLGPRI